jgi:aminoglycoside phosphotransferase (APT) family kinase protein
LTWTLPLKRLSGVWLEQSQVAHYLLSLGLVNPRAVLEEDLTVTDTSRRNSVYLVRASSGPTYVVKQAEPSLAASLANEAAVIRGLAQLPGLAGHVPELAHHDAASARLVLRSPAGAIAWGDPRRPPRIAAQVLGRVLASVHQARLELESPAHDSERLWGLWLPEPSSEQLNQMSAAALDLLARVQASQELCDRLLRLRDALGRPGFVHGDLRWDNCLIVPAPGARRRTRVLLIDWELAGPGEPAADLGAVLGDYVRMWVDSVPKVAGSDTLRFAGRAGHPLERMRPAMQVLWESYRRAAVRPIAVARVAELAAVRLLQAAMEYAQGLVRPTGDVVALVQVADNILRRPTHAASALMGLRA